MAQNSLGNWESVMGSRIVRRVKGVVLIGMIITQPQSH
jgi:hypothetical protein